MIASEIVTRVQRQFGDESGVQITEADVFRWINDAQIDIATNNDLLQAVATTNLTAGSESLPLLPAILRLRSIHLNGTKLTPLSTQEAEEFIAGAVPSGTPTHFWVWANSLYIYPKPVATVAVSVFYTKRPATVTTGADTPELPLHYHTRIVEYCLQQAYELDENWQAAAAKQQQYKGGVDALKGSEDWSERDFYPSITSVPEWDYGW